jgi:hypothetical protein
MVWHSPSRGQDEPTKPNILRWAYEIISQTGHFKIACREWHRMDATTKTLALFKSHFKAAYRDMRSEATTGTAGYHGTPTHAAGNSVVARETDLIARLAASEQALARTLSQASIAPTVDTAAYLSTITLAPPRAN